MDKLDKVLQPYKDFKTHCLHRGIPFQISEINLMEKFEVGLLNYIDELQNKTKKYNILEQENFDLRNKLNTEEESCVMLEKKVKKLKDIIQILNRIYGFKLQYIPYNGYPELLIPDMTSDELTKEEYELLKEEIEEL